MLKYLGTILLLFALLFGWVVVQSAARLYAKRHPEFGCYREEGSGCGSCGKNCREDRTQ
jgi:hypothetical protein